MTSKASVYEDSNEVYESVKNYYGKVLNSTSDLKTSACTTSGRPPQMILDLLKQVPCEIKSKYYGCGLPLPFGIAGLNVLDLGSGSGRDCYLAAAMTGPCGMVTGIDMTDSQLQIARSHVDEFITKKLKYLKPNLRFVKGYIEFLEKAGIENESQDLVISNCVVNLSPNKPRVLEEVYKCLRTGGEFYFSDVYCSRRLPEEVRKHEVLLGECIGGALYIEDFKRICHKVGFSDPRQLSISPIEVHDEDLKMLLGEAKFYSITYRCFKVELESLCEDYGHIAVYNGGIPGHLNSYVLDDHHFFEAGLPMRVCGNTANMVGKSWLGKYFTVIGSFDKHYGLFDCSEKPMVANTAAISSAAPGSSGSSCC